MAWFQRNRSREDALDSALSRIYEAQAKQVEAITGFLEKMSELSMRRAASALGSRGGQVSAKRKAARIAVAAERKSGCLLCRDPLARNISVETIVRHREHEEADEQPAGTNGGPVQ
jgi:hypothetical protein